MRIKDVLNEYFSPALDLRVQVFNMLGCGGMVAGVASALSALLTGAGVFNAALNLAISAFALCLLVLARRTKRYEFFFPLTVVAVFYLAFPAMFFISGGYRGGMPCWFVFAVIFTMLMLERAARVAFIAGEAALYISCCLIAYAYPGAVTAFPSDRDALIDILIGVFAVGAILLFVIRQYIRIYDDRQKRLLELDKLKSEFLENVSHELKTPITVMRNYAVDTLRELEKEPLNRPEMAFNQERIRSESERLERMVSQLLSVTALDGGRRKLHKERVSLAVLLARVTDASFNALNENGNRLSLEIAESLPDLDADPDAIEQIVLNLISNAARHAKNGTITVSLAAGDRFQTVRVSDDGEGMAPHIRRQVFLRYVERESRVTGRSGMGLYICKKLIDAHGGEIGIESEPGKGATAWFSLPEAEAGEVL